MFAASILIATKNRVEDARKAIRSAVSQSIPVEVIVVDDGSTDGTGDAISAEFPGVRLIRSAVSRGYIVQRNLASSIATSEILVSIDDDAEFSSPHTVEQTLADFDRPAIGAVAIPYVEPKYSPEAKQVAPASDQPYVSDSFKGTAYAVRKDLFLGLGGYREHFVHQGEEGDFCLRLMNAGYFVRLGRADPIIHYESPLRDLSRMDYFGARNLLLFSWHNVPFPPLIPHLMVTLLRAATFTFAPKRFWRRCAGIGNAVAMICSGAVRREPVSNRHYWFMRRLKKEGPLPLSTAVESLKNG